MARIPRPIITIAVAACLGAACGSPAPPTSAPSEGAPSPVKSTPASAAPSASGAGGPIGSTGSIAVLADDGSISVLAADGSTVLLDDTSDGTYGFPTWSPDGSRIAAVRSDGTKASVVVLDADRGAMPTPTVIFAKATASPFYLYWTPGGDAVSFLATENGVLSLRLAPADGSAPVDGSGAGSIVRSGNPFYYDWIARNRLFAHIGAGTEAFLGEVGLDGRADEALDTPGDFRAGVVSPDRASIAFVRGAIGGPGEVVISGRDGSNPHSMTVYGQTALLFDPSGTRVAAIGASSPDETAGFPLGPVRLIDGPSGEVRTLVDGAVASFWWSPDGRTIAALRVQETIGSATPSGEQPREPISEVRLLFVDVATGKTLSQPVIRPTERFVTGLIAYFDQYALSHRLWAPDGSAFLMPEIGDDGATHVVVRHPDGSDPITIDGEIAFWSP